MKGITSLLFISSIIIFVFQGCLVTNYIAPPIETIQGSEVRKEINKSVTIGTAVGAMGYLARFRNNGYDLSYTWGDYYEDLGANDAFIIAPLLAGLIAEKNINVNDAMFYTKNSTKECTDLTRERASLLMNSLLDDSNEDIDIKCEQKAISLKTGEYNQQKHTTCIIKEIQSLGIQVGIITGSLCTPVESGKIIHLHDNINI